MSLLIVLLVGAIVGWLAGMLVGGSGGIVRNIIVGVVGALIASLIFGGANILNAPLNMMSFLYSLIGAVILLVILQFATGRRRAL